MGRSPPPPPSQQFPPSSSSLSSADDWFFKSSDRDTQILTQALTQELSSFSRGPAPAAAASSSSLFPSPALCSSSSSFYETFSRCLEERPLQNQSFEALWALQQQQQQQQQLIDLQQQHKAAAMPSMWPHRDGFSHLEQIPQQKGSPLSSNCSPPLSASAEDPASPFSTSTLSTNSAVSTIATEGLLAHSQPRHYDGEDGQFACMKAPSMKPSEVSSMCNNVSPPSKVPSRALSSQASAGVGGCKVNKRRSRSNSKTPIAVLSANPSNFRAMVQQLTGIPSSSSIQSITHGGIPLLKPQPVRHPFANNLNLPTLDTSACFLGPKNMKEGFSFTQRPHQLSSSLTAANLRHVGGVNDLLKVEGCSVVDDNTVRSHMPLHVKQSVFDEQPIGINHNFSSMPSSRWESSADKGNGKGNVSSLYEGEQISNKQNGTATTPATSDNLLMEEHLPPKSSMTAGDSWLSFLEGAHTNHAFNMEIARMA